MIETRVTQEDLELAHPDGGTTHCLAAIVLKRATGQDWRVGFRSAQQITPSLVIWHTDEATEALIWDFCYNRHSVGYYLGKAVVVYNPVVIDHE